MKYALEGIKAILLLNGAASISILTFIGNTKMSSSFLIYALVFFGIGAASSAPTLFFAYLTQLFYGNNNHSAAFKLHYATYGLAIFGIFSFLLGISFSAYGLSGFNVKPS